MTGSCGSQPITILCVDDNPLVADALAAKLRIIGGFDWLGHLPSADRLVEVVFKLQPAVVLLDIDMPGCDPFDALRELVSGGCETRVLVFSGHVRRELLDLAIEIGAWGYISKSDGEDALLEGVRGVAAGEFVLSPEVQAKLNDGREA